LHQACSEFLQEYDGLGHMNQTNEDTSSAEERYYLPHHAVFKSSSSTTRTRVVFYGSCRSSNGLSLNDTLLLGSPVQRDLYSIVLRFRTYQIASTPDIAKMYPPSQDSSRRQKFAANFVQKILCGNISEHMSCQR